MAGGVFSNNTTLKVSAAVAASGTSGTLYTAPANGYAVLNVSILAGGGVGSYLTLNVGGNPVYHFYMATASSVIPKNDSGAAAGAANASSGTSFIQIYVGPSQTVTITNQSGTPTVYLSGVAFINSP